MPISPASHMVFVAALNVPKQLHLIKHRHPCKACFPERNNMTDIYMTTQDNMSI